MALVKCKKCGLEISPKLRKCPGCGTTTKTLPRFSLVPFFLVIGILALIGYTLSLGWTTQLKDVSEKAVEEKIRQTADQIIAKKVFLPKYVIYDRHFAGEADQEMLYLKIIVLGKYTKRDVQSLLKQLYYADRAKRGFYQFRYTRNIEILIYASKYYAESPMEQWLGKLTFTTGDEDPEIYVNEIQVKYLSQEDDVQYGVSKDSRIQLWHQIVHIEKKAEKEAEEVYPQTINLVGIHPELNEVLMERFQFEEMIKEKYKDELARVHNLKREQIDEIAIEGIQKDWPYPKDR